MLAHMLGDIMPSRRQEKVARVIKESVSDTISNRLSDPRIKGLVSVTKVDISPDLRSANVYLSIMAADESERQLTFKAIEHASRYIQTRLGRKMTSKFCPHLHFHEDTEFKQTLETLRMIEEVSQELHERQPHYDEENIGDSFIDEKNS